MHKPSSERIPSQWQNNAYPKPQTSWQVSNAPQTLEHDLEAESLIHTAAAAAAAASGCVAQVQDLERRLAADAGLRPLATTPLRYIESALDLEAFLSDILADIEPTTENSVSGSVSGTGSSGLSLDKTCAFKKAVAIDLEAHSYRSYQGFVCLVQISSVDCDAVIDALALRSALADPSGAFIRLLRHPRVVKVMHGADSDVLWLQRDFTPAARIVNLFDTARAAQLLGEPSVSLAHLISCYARDEDRTADPASLRNGSRDALASEKRVFQVADWRIRPLPSSMLHYARQDTHYLLYLYRVLSTRLVQETDPNSPETNRLQQLWLKSADVALRRYALQEVAADAHLKVARQYKAMLSDTMLPLLRDLIHWRDQIAREADESPPYVFPNHFLIALVRETPRSPFQLDKMLRRLGLARGRCLLSRSTKCARRLLALIRARLSVARAPGRRHALRSQRPAVERLAIEASGVRPPWRRPGTQATSHQRRHEEDDRRPT